MEEAFFGRETVIFILRNLGPVKKNKTKKNLAWNKQINGTLGIYRKLGAHNNLPPRRKKRKDNVPLQNTFEYGSNGSLREIANVLGMLTSIYQTVLPGPFHYQSLRMQQIKNQVHLTQGCRGELNGG